jgi:hypothetical protein
MVIEDMHNEKGEVVALEAVMERVVYMVTPNPSERERSDIRRKIIEDLKREIEEHKVATHK